MIRRRQLAVAAAAGLALLCAASGRTEEASPPGAAAGLQAVKPRAAIRMLAGDARRVGGRARARGRSPGSDAAHGVTRRIVVSAPPVENRSAEFVFRDETLHTPPASRRVRSAAEREAAVERYRQSLAKGGKARP